MGTRLFNRDVIVQIDTKRFASVSESGQPKKNLRVAFTVKRTPDPDPNTCQIQLWNLSADSRAFVEVAQKNKKRGFIQAGYENETQELFRGDIDKINNTREGPDWVTTIELADGIQAYRAKRVKATFPPGASFIDVIKEAAAALGLGTGNLDDTLASVTPRDNLTQFGKGTVLSGKASDELGKLLKSLGIEWSVQDGQIQALGPKLTNKKTAQVFNSGSGLVGSPEAGEDGKVTAKVLLRGSIVPGDKVKIQSAVFDGFFKVLNVAHTGDTHSETWYTDFEGEPLGT